ncbi:hypothetical protein MKW98_004064 [Papaver atlanticum]|uniref:Uncharacterized protein n=1 Tax=Papaver atlanticum TaxID=357466 RepID=A0AAD4SZ00_9MAGN|nr:hypothetical protein MKW98_004064 [Papaver atlanticum]
MICLQQIGFEDGKHVVERKNMLCQIEKECLGVYETIQERLDYATIHLCQMEDETGQEFVIEFESQPNELQEKEFADAPTV